MTPALGEAFFTSAIRFSRFLVLVVTAWKKLRGRPSSEILSLSCSIGAVLRRSATSWRLVSRIFSRMVCIKLTVRPIGCTLARPRIRGHGTRAAHVLARACHSKPEERDVNYRRERAGGRVEGDVELADRRWLYHACDRDLCP